MKTNKEETTSATDKEESLLQTFKEACIYGLAMVLMVITRQPLTNELKDMLSLQYLNHFLL